MERRVTCGSGATTAKLRVRTVGFRPEAVVLIDQLALPHDERYVTCSTWREVAACISDMTVRGAPAIGVAAAGALALAAREACAVEPEARDRVRRAARRGRSGSRRHPSDGRQPHLGHRRDARRVAALHGNSRRVLAGSARDGA